MARVYKILGQRNPSANVLSTVYTVPSSNSAIISSIVISNLDETVGNGAAFRIAANNFGVQVANGNYLAYSVNVPARDTVTLTLGITMETTAIIQHGNQREY